MSRNDLHQISQPGNRRSHIANVRQGKGFGVASLLCALLSLYPFYPDNLYPYLLDVSYTGFVMFFGNSGFVVGGERPAGCRCDNPGDAGSRTVPADSGD
jgi:hypothetical protein